ncbi:MAG TPA: tetratricopeptide repeat protein [Vicinamibacteria bacterium]|nr:tetratricopeptide repeat protein [Vicinamibacteria bacterium]
MEFGPFRLDPEARVLSRGDTAVSLTPKAFDTLVALVEARDRLATKSELMQRLWPDAVVEESNLTQQIFTLRKALGDDSEGQTYIRTVPRHGYRFVADVREVPLGATATPSVATVPASPEPAWTPRPGRRVGRGLAVVVAVVVLLAATVLWLTGGREVAAGTLAVVPLRNGSGTSDLEYLADGLTEGLIRDLGSLPRLRILGPSTAFRYKDGATPPREVGRTLKADVVLTGEVAARGDTVDVHAVLIEVATGRTVWEQRYAAGVGELPQVQGRIRDAVARRLAREPGTPPARRARHVDDEAYRLCLRGRFFWNKRTAEGLRHAIEQYRMALRRDAKHAEAWSGLADAYSVLPEYSDTTEDEAYPAARHAATQAIAIDPDLAEAHASLGFVLFWWDHDAAGSEREFRRALELNPGYATAHHWYGNALLSLDRVEEALAELEMAHRADPLSLIIGAERGAALYHARRSGEAAEQLRRTIELDPRFPDAHYWLARTLLAQGDADGALEELRRTRELYPEPSEFLGEQGVALAAAGRTAEARAALARLNAMDRERLPAAHGQALLHAALGENAEALSALERAAGQRATDLAFMGTDPLLDPLRGEPGFAAVQQRLRRPRQTE